MPDSFAWHTADEIRFLITAVTLLEVTVTKKKKIYCSRVAGDRWFDRKSTQAFEIVNLYTGANAASLGEVMERLHLKRSTTTCFCISKTLARLLLRAAQRRKTAFYGKCHPLCSSSQLSLLKKHLSPLTFLEKASSWSTADTFTGRRCAKGWVLQSKGPVFETSGNLILFLSKSEHYFCLLNPPSLPPKGASRLSASTLIR